ncbi:MAG: aminopeptidase P N-terminal domain-containing protein [Defluviitaleaceae bacterium]|nr:aminopeptidase P N-terminal domain-containing protein [Defluviitaleaceae bacterium]
MDKSFYTSNRQALQARLENDAIAIVCSGSAPRRTNDEYYHYFADRNFLYLTGVDQCDAIYFSTPTDEALYVPPEDAMWERWNGERVKADAASEISGITNVRPSGEFDRRLDYTLGLGKYSTVYIPLFKYTREEPDGKEYQLAKYIRDRFPHIIIKDLMPHMKALRLIKKPCEIEAIRKATEFTREGILAMMRAAKPGITELELRAEFLYAIMKAGASGPAAPPIISAGKNNFCIHYHDHKGVAHDGDFILNDVGTPYNNIVTDVSRGWPVNGRFNERQRLLYQCAYDTSEYMFRIIKPGMPMKDVDGIIKKYNYERLKEIGLCKSWDDIGTYMWHGGAHHVGFDVHDVVEVTPDTPLAPGMIFCVDIGIYVEEWGIGFRLEDNCLVTKTGCENLSASIPRSIEEIEAVMN